MNVGKVCRFAKTLLENEVWYLKNERGIPFWGAVSSKWGFVQKGLVRGKAVSGVRMRTERSIRKFFVFPILSPLKIKNFAEEGCFSNFLLKF